MRDQIYSRISQGWVLILTRLLSMLFFALSHLAPVLLHVPSSCIYLAALTPTRR